MTPAEMLGMKDSRGMAGIMARGNNVYNGGTNNAGRAGGRSASTLDPRAAAMQNAARMALSRGGPQPGVAAPQAPINPDMINALMTGVAGGGAPQGMPQQIAADRQAQLDFGASRNQAAQMANRQNQGVSPLAMAAQRMMRRP